MEGPCLLCWWGWQQAEKRFGAGLRDVLSSEVRVMVIAGWRVPKSREMVRMRLRM